VYKYVGRHDEAMAELGLSTGSPRCGNWRRLRGRDTSLERDVALKFLAENLRQDRVGRERSPRRGPSAMKRRSPA
jgi:hypothetical protein